MKQRNNEYYKLLELKARLMSMKKELEEIKMAVSVSEDDVIRNPVDDKCDFE